MEWSEVSSRETEELLSNIKSLFKIVVFNLQRGEGEHFDFAQRTICEGR
jgi:hypothetical protein